MTFRKLVVTTRLRKKEFDPKAYTQAACGSRMIDNKGNPTPIGQVGWSRYETEDSRPDYDTVVGIAYALGEPPDAFLKAAGYPVPGEVEAYAGGKHVILQDELKQRELEEIKRKVAELQEALNRFGMCVL